MAAARAQNDGNDVSRATSPSGKFGTAGIVLKATAGRLYRLEVVNASATAYFLMVFDKATAPVNTDTPIWRRRLPVSGEVVLDLERFGLYCANGIGIALSSTDGTLTLAVSLDGHYGAFFK